MNLRAAYSCIYKKLYGIYDASLIGVKYDFMKEPGLITIEKINKWCIQMFY